MKTCAYPSFGVTLPTEKKILPKEMYTPFFYFGHTSIVEIEFSDRGAGGRRVWDFGARYRGRGAKGAGCRGPQQIPVPGPLPCQTGHSSMTNKKKQFWVAETAASRR